MFISRKSSNFLKAHVCGHHVSVWSNVSYIVHSNTIQTFKTIKDHVLWILALIHTIWFVFWVDTQFLEK